MQHAGALKPFCMKCRRNLLPGWDRPDARVQENPMSKRPSPVALKTATEATFMALHGRRGPGAAVSMMQQLPTPLEILLFERLENHRQRGLLGRLPRIPVDFEFDLTEPELAWTR